MLKMISSDATIVSPAAFATATRPIMPGLRGYANHLTQHAVAADDLVQDTRAWAARLRSQPGAWLFTFLRNSLLSSVRRGGLTVAWADSVSDRLLVAYRSRSTV